MKYWLSALDGQAVIMCDGALGDGEKTIKRLCESGYSPQEIVDHMNRRRSLFHRAMAFLTRES